MLISPERIPYNQLPVSVIRPAIRAINPLRAEISFGKTITKFGETAKVGSLGFLAREGTSNSMDIRSPISLSDFPRNRLNRSSPCSDIRINLGLVCVQVNSRITQRYSIPTTETFDGEERREDRLSAFV